MAEIIERLSVLETNLSNVAQDQTEIKSYLGKLFSETGDIKTGLSLVIQNQSSAQKYQEDCTADRINLEKRVDTIDLTHARQAGKMLGISMAISTVIAALGIGIEWLKK